MKKDVQKYLTPRMMIAAQCVKPCKQIYDIGTDHCYIPIYLIQSGKCKKAIATDIKKGPVKKAKENIVRFNVENSITAFVSDGISHVENDADILIAGMGADVIISILSSHFDYAKSAEQIVIQCQSKTEKLRAFLWDNGFDIYAEKLAEEKNKVYNAFCTVYTGNKAEYSFVDAAISKLLVSSKHYLLNRYITQYLTGLKARMEGMIKTDNKAEVLKLSEIIDELEGLS